MREALTWDEARRLRVHAQGLGARRGADVAAAARTAGAVQAQDRLGEWLGVATRSHGLTADDVERARMIDRSVTRSWLMRGTLHLALSEDLRWLLGLLGEAMDRKALKRRADLGISPDDHDRVLAFLREHLTLTGPLTRAEIAEALRSAGLPWENQATPHLLRTASLLGVICFGPNRDGEATHVLIDDWLPRSGCLPPNPAAELARRFFAAYGPATAADLRWWSGLPAADVRQAMQAIVTELVKLRVEGRPIWIPAEAAAEIEEVLTEQHGVVRVLGPFDPYLLGYAKRELGVSDTWLKRINAGGGMIRSCVLSDGRLVGTWERKRRARGLSVIVTALEPLSDHAQSQLEGEFKEIGRFLGTEIRWSLTLDHDAARSG